MATTEINTNTPATPTTGSGSQGSSFVSLKDMSFYREIYDGFNESVEVFQQISNAASEQIDVRQDQISAQQDSIRAEMKEKAEGKNKNKTLGGFGDAFMGSLAIGLTLAITICNPAIGAALIIGQAGLYTSDEKSGKWIMQAFNGKNGFETDLTEDQKSEIDGNIKDLDLKMSEITKEQEKLTAFVGGTASDNTNAALANAKAALDSKTSYYR